MTDLFELFPDLPGVRHHPPVDQMRRARLNVERMHRHTKRNIAFDLFLTFGLHQAACYDRPPS
jgi:hypothetical protein